MFSRIFWYNMTHETWICIYKCCWCLGDSHVKEAIGCTVWNIWRILWSDATTTTGDEAGHTTQHLEGKKGSTGTLRTWSGMSCLPLVEDRLGVGVASDLTSKQVTRQSHLVFVQCFLMCVSHFLYSILKWRVDHISPKVVKIGCSVFGCSWWPNGA